MKINEYDNLSMFEKAKIFEDNKKIKPNNSLIIERGLNDVLFKTTITIEGMTRTHPAYETYCAMFRRCYSKNSLIKNPTYENCSVCNEWMKFSSFLVWWKNNYIENYNLDKDILFVGNKVYSPNKCIYIPQWLNNFVTDSKKVRGNYKIGVRLRYNGKFEARCNDSYGNNIYLGLYDCENSAHQAWLKYKLSVLEQRKFELDLINKNLFYLVRDKILSLS